MDNIKYIILDFGKVIAAPATGNWFITPKFLELVDMSKIDVEKFNQKVKLFNSFLSKKIRTEEEEYLMFFEFYQNILNSLEYPNTTRDLVQQLAMDFTYSSLKYSFYPGIEEELKSLSSNYKLLLLTDNWPCVRRILKEKGLDKYFEKIYVSSEVGCEKKDGIFFDYPINDYKINPGEGLFVDDNDSLLSIAEEKGLDVRLMVRGANKMVVSNHPIINSLNEIFNVKTL